MEEKIILLKKLDDVISKESTSQESIKLLEEVRQELIEAKTKEEHIKVILKIAGAIGAVAKLASTILKIFKDSG